MNVSIQNETPERAQWRINSLSLQNHVNIVFPNTRLLERKKKQCEFIPGRNTFPVRSYA